MLTVFLMDVAVPPQMYVLLVIAMPAITSTIASVQNVILHAILVMILGLTNVLIVRALTALILHLMWVRLKPVLAVLPIVTPAMVILLNALSVVVHTVCTTAFAALQTALSAPILQSALLAALATNFKLQEHA